VEETNAQRSFSGPPADCSSEASGRSLTGLGLRLTGSQCEQTPSGLRFCSL
jgi:hypothetical protein